MGMSANALRVNMILNNKVHVMLFVIKLVNNVRIRNLTVVLNVIPILCSIMVNVKLK